MKSHLRILLYRHKALGKPIQDQKAEYGKDWRHGGGLIFFGLDVIIFVIVVQIVVVIIPVIFVARAIAIVVAPVAIGTNRAIDHVFIFERRRNCFLSYVCITAVINR